MNKLKGWFERFGVWVRLWFFRRGAARIQMWNGDRWVDITKDVKSIEFESDKREYKIGFNKDITINDS